MYKTKIHAGALSARDHKLQVELQSRINSATCDIAVIFVLSSTATKGISKIYYSILSDHSNDLPRRLATGFLLIITLLRSHIIFL